VKTLTLYRPIGPKELQLIEQSSWTKFPLRTWRTSIDILLGESK
jgi:hypothetical protein